MKKTKKWLRRLMVFSIVLLIYPVFVIGYTWTHVLRSDLEGGRHGPLDAYRHALASAVVSYTLGEWAVDVVTTLFESGGKDSNWMDRKNNSIGATIGASSSSLADLEARVREQVIAGSELSTVSTQITWLPIERWRESKLW